MIILKILYGILIKTPGLILGMIVFCIIWYSQFISRWDDGPYIKIKKVKSEEPK